MKANRRASRLSKRGGWGGGGGGGGGGAPIELLVGEEFHSLIRNDADTIGAIALHHAAKPILLSHVFESLQVYAWVSI